VNATDRDLLRERAFAAWNDSKQLRQQSELLYLRTQRALDKSQEQVEHLEGGRKRLETEKERFRSLRESYYKTDSLGLGAGSFEHLVDRAIDLWEDWSDPGSAATLTLDGTMSLWQKGVHHGEGAPSVSTRGES